ncbi:MAG: hypothetical protein NDI82_03900 [Anaeromyxobacteraceae bacterium]|nr:hypothetical protein [Anaeromyxobacteraceae bacterium]
MARARLLLAALAVLGATALTGCNPYLVNLRHDELRPTAGFTFVDARPEDQKSSGNESLLITSCDYGIYRIGDDKFTPDRVAVLRSDLDRALGAELAGRKVTLKAYTVHFNLSERLRGQVAASHSGLIPALMNDTSVHGCAADDLTGGFTGNERTTAGPPLIVVIDLEVDGKEVHARWFESSPTHEVVKTDSPEWHDWVSKALERATAKAVEGTRAALARR